MSKENITPSASSALPLSLLKRFTEARIAQDRCGISLSTQEHLRFQYDHAKARCAVHGCVNFASITAYLDSLNLPHVHLTSAVKDRAQYLKRPDLGRILGAASKNDLKAITSLQEFDLSIIIGDGLSALAIMQNAVPMLDAILPTILNQWGWHLSPIALTTQARVAIGDDIASSFKSKMALVFIGERPGLSSPDSMGMYLTWNPQMGTADSKRNCISNIRAQGLSYKTAASKLLFLMEQARSRKLSGVELKDETTETPVLEKVQGINFLVS